MRAPKRSEIWILAVVLAAVFVWTGRYFVNPDGVSYLDLSDDFAQGRWANAVNAHWSPAYPFLLSVWLRPFAYGSQWESLAVHVLNGVLFLCALRAFEFLLEELSRAWPSVLDTTPGRVAAYAAFMWSMLVLVTIKVVTPDMMLAPLVLVPAALQVRIQSGRGSGRDYALLGIALGIAALTKSFMFSVGIAMLLMSAFATRRIRGAMRMHLLSAALFLVITIPQLVAVSQKAGHLTFSESARVVYGLKVNRFPKLSPGRDAFDIKLVNLSPRLFTFSENLPNRSYPVWDDPARVYRNMPVHFETGDQLRALKDNISKDARIALKILLPLLVVFLCRDKSVKSRNRLLLLITALVLTAYALMYSESRLIGLWLAIGIVSLLSGITLDMDERRRRIGFLSLWLMVGVAVVSTGRYVFDQTLSKDAHSAWNVRNLQYDVAQQLQRLGVRPGSRVALVGDESDIYWSRLARVRVVAQVPLSDADVYWKQSNVERARLNMLIHATGAAAIVASWTEPPHGFTNDWIRVPGTRYSILPMTSLK